MVKVEYRYSWAVVQLEVGAVVAMGLVMAVVQDNVHNGMVQKTLVVPMALVIVVVQDIVHNEMVRETLKVKQCEQVVPMESQAAAEVRRWGLLMGL